MKIKFSKKLILLKLIAAYVTLSCSISTYAEDRKYNLAFDEAFIGYISDRLALQLARNEHLEPNPNLDKEESGFRQMHLMDARMNYRSKLISCDGPLKELSKHLEHYDFESNDDKYKTDTLRFVGNKESEIWPIIEAWDNKVRDEIMKTHHSGFKTFPDCIADGYVMKLAE